MIFRHHFPHTILVASTERPTMPTSTPLLDALKAEKSAQRDKEAIQRNHAHYKDAAQASKKDDSKKKAAAAAAAASGTPEAKQGGDLTAQLGKRAAKKAAAAAAAA
jgi:regulator of nonsense transcripts 3